MCQLLIVPSIRGRDIGFLEWPDIRSFEHLLQLLDFINYAFNIHPQQYSEPALTRHFVLRLRQSVSLFLLRSSIKPDQGIGTGNRFVAGAYDFVCPSDRRSKCSQVELRVLQLDSDASEKSFGAR